MVSKMKIVFTNHVNKKFADLSELGIKVKKNLIQKIILEPNHKNKEADYPNIIVTGELDEIHVLRVVLITFYPSKKGRYH